MILGILPPWLHMVFEWLAYFVGFRLMRRDRVRDPIDVDHRNWVIGGCIVGAALGSKAVVWLDHPAWFLQQATHPGLELLAGKGIGGALVGGWLGVELTKKIMGLKQATGDLFVVPLIVATMIGRIGCFLNGLQDQTYGIATTLPWGVDFGDGVLRHPAQLYEVLFLAGLLAVIHWRRQTAYPQGELFRYFMMGYFAFRLAIEFIKPVPHPYGGINGTQLLSLGVLLFYGFRYGRLGWMTLMARQDQYKDQDQNQVQERIQPQ